MHHETLGGAMGHGGQARGMFEAARSACVKLAALSVELDALEEGEWDGVRHGAGAGGPRGVHSDPTASTALARRSAYERTCAEFDALAEQVEEASKIVAQIGSQLGWDVAEAVELYYLCGQGVSWWDVGAEMRCSAATARRRRDEACAWVDSVGWYELLKIAS